MQLKIESSMSKIVYSLTEEEHDLLSAFRHVEKVRTQGKSEGQWLQFTKNKDYLYECKCLLGYEYISFAIPHKFDLEDCKLEIENSIKECMKVSKEYLENQAKLWQYKEN